MKTANPTAVMRISRSTSRLWPLLILWLLPLMVLGGCEPREGESSLSARAKLMWENGQYADAARNFVTLSEIHPDNELGEESLYWAANLFQHYLNNPGEAIRFYQQLLVSFPKGPFANEAKENLAILYEEKKDTRHRALQILQQLLLEKDLKDRQDHFQFKIAALNLKMGVMDQARFEFRNLITRHPNSVYIPEAFYLVGYSYYLEGRLPLAQVAFRQIVQDFPGTPLSRQAQFYIAEIEEERGNLRAALRQFESLRGKYHSRVILDKRIKALRSRMKKSVR